MIETAWQLGGLPQYEGLNLRRWAHMLGFRGHFLTKSRAYSTTFTVIRAGNWSGRGGVITNAQVARVGRRRAGRGC
jgi:hypothetical protein